MADDSKVQQPARQPRRRIAKGPARPQYLANRDIDRVMIMFTALVSEMFALRDRVDTHEALLERDGQLTRASIEAFRPSEELEAVREAERLASMRRIFRVLREEFEEYRDVAPDDHDAPSY
jgi:hypothetical protein